VRRRSCVARREVELSDPVNGQTGMCLRFSCETCGHRFHPKAITGPSPAFAAVGCPACAAPVARVELTVTTSGSPGPGRADTSPGPLFPFPARPENDTEASHAARPARTTLGRPAMRRATAGTGPQPSVDPLRVRGLFGDYSRRQREYAELRGAVAERSRLAAMWRGACEGVELCHRVRVPAGMTISTPTVVGCLPGDPVALIVRLLPGQLPRDVEDQASRLAPAMGAARLRVTPRGEQHVRVDLLAHDPLADVFTLPAVVSAMADIPLFIGTADTGLELRSAWARRPHCIVQGATGSGKSSWTYGQLSDAAACPDVLVAGLDPSGLLWRPFAGTRHAGWQVSGLTADLAAHEKLLRRLVDEMDRRTTGLPADTDSLTPTVEQPLMVVVLEDYAGLIQSAEAADRKQAARVRALIMRLLAEGRKAAIRVVILVQRAEANVVGAFERSNCALRISFGVDSPESVRLLHPAAPDPDDHVSAPPGVALLSAPGVPLVRFRAGLVGDYAAYCRRVQVACS